MRRIYLLRRTQAGTVLHWPAAHCAENLFQGTDDANGVEIVVIPDVSDAEQLAFHLTLAISYDRGKRVSELFHDGAGIDASRSRDCSQRSRRTAWREQLQTESLGCCACHLSAQFSVIDQRHASGN